MGTSVLKKNAVAVCDVKNSGKTPIVNLPGSEKAVRESLEYIMKPMLHGLDILRGTGDN